ncbi:MAG TPA: hypothetical protein VN577_15270 [Terriglobales bacterium]|nr:hypothetical protein [Terriglobales bacterium]
MTNENKNRGTEPPKNEHGQGFADRPAGEKSRYDPELEMPDPEQVERDIEEVEKVYREDKNEDAA